MKAKMPAFVLGLSLAIPGTVSGAMAADSAEQEVRGLDRQEAQAVLAADYATIDRLWAKDLIVNNPFNEVVRAKAGPVRTGALIYASFVREIEAVEVHGQVAVVMGRETVVPKADSPDSGKTIHRRYTNVWMKTDGQWRLTARHANVVCGG